MDAFLSAVGGTPVSNAVTSFTTGDQNFAGPQLDAGYNYNPTTSPPSLNVHAPAGATPGTFNVPSGTVGTLLSFLNTGLDSSNPSTGLTVIETANVTSFTEGSTPVSVTYSFVVKNTSNMYATNLVVSFTPNNDVAHPGVAITVPSPAPWPRERR